MVTDAQLDPGDIHDLDRSFSEWAANSVARTDSVRATLPVFSLHNSTAILDAARASYLIRTGLRSGHIYDLVGLLGLNKKEDLSHALKTNSTSLRRWAKYDKPLSGTTVELILRAMQLQFIAADVFGSLTLSRNWLHKPHPSLDGMTPSDFADNEFGAHQVRGMLAGLKYGGVA